ncbi:MAG: hypothetical protein ACYDEE_07285 [Ignavibacteriaceae bacterium]
MKTKSSSKYYLPLLLFLLLPAAFSIGQVNGISGSKLCVPDAEVVSKGKFEFEPSLSVSPSAKQFDSDWNLEPLNGSSYASLLQFRITLGVAEGLEIGTSFSTAMDEIYVGSKAVLSSAGTLQIARAAEDLNRLTDQLQQLIDRFKLDNNVKQTNNEKHRSGYAVRKNGKLIEA